MILSAHASLIDATGRWSSTDVEEFFAWLHDEEVAGRVALLPLSVWPWAKSTPTT